MARNINSVTITGNLTRDPEVRSLSSGSSVCKLGVAVNESYKDQSGEWKERANFFDVTVWGAQGEACGKYLSRGRPVAVQGRLRWRSWEAQDGTKRSAVEIVADTVQFLSGGDGSGGGRSGGGATGGQQSDVPVDTSDQDFAGVQAVDDDIPF